jgi:MFS family permease
MIVPPLAAALYGVGGWRLAFLGTAVVGLLWIPAWLHVTGKPAVRAKLDTHAMSGAASARPTFMMLLTDLNVIRALLAILAIAPIFALSLSWGAKYLARTFWIAQEDVGHFLWMPPLLFDAGALLFGDLASRQRRAPGAPPRFLFSIGIVLALSLAGMAYAVTPWAAMSFMGLSMAGGGIVYTLATADLLSRVPPGSVSFAGGTIACAQSVAIIIANPLIGLSVDRTGSYDVAIFSLAAWVLPGCLFWLLVRPRPTETA